MYDTLMEFWNHFSEAIMCMADDWTLEKGLELFEDKMIHSDFFSAAVLSTVGLFLWTTLKKPFTSRWAKIKSWTRRRTRFQAYVDENNNIYEYVNDYLKDHYEGSFRTVEYKWKYDYKLKSSTSKSLPLGKDKIQIKENPEDRLQILQFNENYVIWHKLPLRVRSLRFSIPLPIWVSKNREKLEVTSGMDNYKDLYNFTSLMKKHLHSFFIEVAKHRIEKSAENFQLRLYTSNYGHWNSSSANPPIRDYDKTIYWKHKQDLIDKFKQYLSSREWYEERGIPYKRGVLLYGPPGNGKSSIIRAFAWKIKRNIYYLNLGDVDSDSDLQKLISNIPSGSILVIEDIDTFVDQRKVLNKGLDAKLTFSGILNCLDGLHSPDDLLTFITTNKVENLDSALLRAGRVDDKYEILNPTFDLVKQYIEEFFEKTISDRYTKLKQTINFSEVLNICRNNSFEDSCNLILE